MCIVLSVFIRQHSQYIILLCYRYELLTNTWKTSPDDRLTFATIVNQLQLFITNRDSACIHNSSENIAES